MSDEYLLPSDLFLKIISILPSKSVARCRCVSKLWASLLTSPDFTELFLTQSKTRPRFLFGVVRNEKEKEWALYSCPLQPQSEISSTKSNSSISVTAEFHMSLPKTSWFVPTSPSVSGGFIHFSNRPHHNMPILCNPSTRQLISLPPLLGLKRSYFGYDPINKQLSILAICFPLNSTSKRDFPSSYQILKLESGRVVSWRSLECPLHHYPELNNICINGILYYIASFGDMYPCKIACFDLNSEEFKFVDVPWPCDSDLLVNLKGKLGGINLMMMMNSRMMNSSEDLELSLWVLEDVEKQEWSTHVYLLQLWDTILNFSISGVTPGGEIVLSLWSSTHTVYLYFFNLETNILHRIEINVIEAVHIFFGWVDYVEDLKYLNWN